MHPLRCQSAQPPTDRSGIASRSAKHLGRIVGIVTDSLAGGPLAYADVLAEGDGVAPARTDSAGRFAIEGLSPGKYRLSVSHPTLDTLGISLVSPEFLVVADSSSFVQLSVPSAPGIVKIECNAPSLNGDTSAVIGHVRSTESLASVPNVEVTLTWTSYVVTNNRSIEKRLRSLSDTTGPNGAYRICGLPGDLQASLQARVAGELRSESIIRIPESGTSLVVRNLAISTISGQHSASSAQISGKVELPSGQPARGSSVEIVGTARKTITDERGKFTLDSVPLGTQTMFVRQIGFREEAIVFDVDRVAAPDLTVKLKEVVPVLPTVNVTATQRDKALEKIGFSLRSEHSVGHFLTADQIAKSSDFRFTDLLRGIPGLTVGIDKHGDDVVYSRRAGGSELNATHGCVQYFVDGIPWGNGALEAMGVARVQDSTAQKMMAQLAIETARQLNTVLKKSEIIGIEVYQGGGAPAYFNQGGHNCATIVIWTTASIGM